MERFDPSRGDAWPHAGTFNNAVLTMAAGAAGLTQVLTPDEIARLNALGDRLRERIAALGVHATGYGSMVGLHGVERAFFGMLERGYWYARRGFVALSLPLTEEDVDGFAAALAAELA